MLSSIWQACANPTPTINDHIVTIQADFYTPMDNVSIPTGEIAKVDGTPMDFRTPHAIGERIDEPFERIGFWCRIRPLLRSEENRDGSIGSGCYLHRS